MGPSEVKQRVHGVLKRVPSTFCSSFPSSPTSQRPFENRPVPTSNHLSHTNTKASINQSIIMTDNTNPGNFANRPTEEVKEIAAKGGRASGGTGGSSDTSSGNVSLHQCGYIFPASSHCGRSESLYLTSLASAQALTVVQSTDSITERQRLVGRRRLQRGTQP